MKTASRILVLVVVLAALLTSTVSVVSAGELFIVNAVSEDSIAAPGNRQPNYIVVSVTAADGTPVSGLTPANFKVDALIVGPGGSLVNIVSVTPKSGGYYILQIVPISTNTWKAGVYVFGVSATLGLKHGQTLASVNMD